MGICYKNKSYGGENIHRKVNKFHSGITNERVVLLYTSEFTRHIRNEEQESFLVFPFEIHVDIKFDYLKERENEVEPETEEEEESEEPVINAGQSFKSNECVICLTNPPNVLFCNCGHIAIREECNKTKSLETCPVCKTKNTIKRMI